MATFSVTEIQEYMRCRRKWNYGSANLQSLGPFAPNRSLSLGTNVHQALAQWLIEPDAKLRDLFLVAAAENLRKIREGYRKQIGANISESELGDFYDGQLLGVKMMENYEEFWGKPLLDGFTIVEPEQKFVVPIPGTEHNLSLRLDALIERTARRTLYILEHKTYSQRPRQSTLEMAFQFLAYIWGARQVFGKKVVGIGYDGMWSRPAPPRGSKMEDLFMRLLIERNEHEIAALTGQLVTLVCEMADLVELHQTPLKSWDEVDSAFYPNRRWQGCFDCGFDELCQMQTHGEDFEHYKWQHFVRLDADKEMVGDGDD